MVGGTSNFAQLLSYGQVQTFNFVGCLRNVNVNGMSSSFLSLTGENGTSACQRSSLSPCASINCQHGGQCDDLWTSGQCLCPQGYSGKTCDTTQSMGLTLSSTNYVQVTVDPVYRHQLQLQHRRSRRSVSASSDDVISISLSTTSSEGLLANLVTSQAQLILLV